MSGDPTLTLVFTIAGMIVEAAAVCGSLYAAIAAFLVGRFMARRPPAMTETPGVSLIKPLHGWQDGLDESIETFCHQDYAGAVQILFGVSDPTDPALTAVRALQARHPECDIAFVADDRSYGANHKISNLINIQRLARNDILVMCDADVRAPPSYIHAIVSSLAGANVGAVTCLYHGESIGNAWSDIAAMGINYTFIPNAILAKMLRLAEPCFGPTIALRAEVLAEIGGLEAFSRFLAEDYEIGRAVRARGYQIAIPTMTITTVCDERSLGDYFHRQVRWARTIRRIAGAGHAGSVVTHPVPLAIIGALLLGFNPLPLGIVLAAVGVRIAAKLFIDHAMKTRAGHWWMVPLADMLSFAVFLASFTGDTVVWQGQRYHVGSDGVLTEL